MITCKNNVIYRRGEKVKSLVNRPPTVQVGTEGRILYRWAGTIYTVKMPNGDLYRWLDNQDLFSVDSGQPNLRVGDFAVVRFSRQNYFYHPQLVNGVVVEIIKIVETDYYTI